MCERYIKWLPLTYPQLGTWPTTQACALIRNQTGDLLVLRPVLNLLSHTSQGKPLFFMPTEHLSTPLYYLLAVT